MTRVTWIDRKRAAECFDGRWYASPKLVLWVLADVAPVGSAALIEKSAALAAAREAGWFRAARRNARALSKASRPWS